MKIYNRTTYDKDLIIKYNKYYFMNFLITRYSFMAAIIIGFSIYLFILHQNNYAFTLIIIVVAYLILILLMQVYSTKKNIKSNPIVANPFVQEYLFTDIELVMSYGDKISYILLSKMKFTKYYILMFSKSTKKTFIISMNGFKTDTDRDECIAFLKQLKSKPKNR